jgi:hypothetical protein
MKKKLLFRPLLNEFGDLDPLVVQIRMDGRELQPKETEIPILAFNVNVTQYRYRGFLVNHPFFQGLSIILNSNDWL